MKILSILQFCWWCISLTLLTITSYILTFLLFMFTSVELNRWKNQNMNYTNFEEIQTEHFRMHILMNAYFLIILINIFFRGIKWLGISSFHSIMGNIEMERKQVYWMRSSIPGRSSLQSCHSIIFSTNIRRAIS